MKDSISPAGTHAGIAGRIAAALIDSKLTPLIVLASVLLGVFSVLMLPREEEPQIRVPMIDVMVSMPGTSAEEMEDRATRPMEKLLWELPGVEYLYSQSREGEAMTIVRFAVGSDPDTSLAKVAEKLRSNVDRMPHGVAFPVLKLRSIDDVPILALTFHSATVDEVSLRRLVAQVDDSVKRVPSVSETAILGGVRRELRILLDPVRLASRGLTPAGLLPVLRQSNRQFRGGELTSDNRSIVVETGGFLHTPAQVGAVVLANGPGGPVHLRDVATVEDGPSERTAHVFHGLGGTGPQSEQPAVTLTIAKRAGSNAISVAHAVLEQVEALKGQVIPADVTVSITRNYGKTAAEKSDELLLHMGIAVVSVSVLIWLTLGWRESGIVAVAIPATLALTLLVFHLHGFTLNRITLFALIFSIGILVDDAIVVVENIVRHVHLPGNRGRSLSAVAVEAVAEVGNPTILATVAVIAAVLPMAFVGGLMGPYMRPIPVGASAAMFWSLLIAFAVTPWASIRILRWRKGEERLAKLHVGGGGAGGEDLLTRLYRRVMNPLLHRPVWRWAFLGGITALLLAAMSTVYFGWVKVKMLPFDNKSEFQVVLNMPEGSSLETTAEAAREIARAIRGEPEVRDYQIYVGLAAPHNFNGLVRHYFLRRGPSVADIQVNLAPKQERSARSHDIAKRVRPAVAAVAERFGARVAVAEVPPGPPVLQTLVAEIYGPTEQDRARLSEIVRGVFRDTAGVVDIDWYVEADQPKVRFVVDREKAALHGISPETVAQTLRIAVAGESVDLLHLPGEKEDVNLVLQLPRSARTHPESLLSLRVRSGDANALPEPAVQDGTSGLVALRELVRLETTHVDKSRHRENLLPVTYVIGDVAGVVESPFYAITEMNRLLRERTRDIPGGVELLNASMPRSDLRSALKWDGEWHITLEVFRDLGIAFGAVLVLIYVLMVGWFRSFLTPMIVMVAIPFSLVGILPAHGLMGVFFSATSMIGFMAGAGIVVRNSIILVDFIEQRVSEGLPLDAAVIDAGAVRFRPMVLTAMAVIVGAAVILGDPIFQGLALSLMAGEIASLLISRMAVPVLYFIANGRVK